MPTLFSKRLPANGARKPRQIARFPVDLSPIEQARLSTVIVHMPANMMSLEASSTRPDPRRRRVMIVAGEASGDLHGAELAREILARDHDCEIFGIAGERMRGVGVRALYRTDEIAGMGLTELAATIRHTLGALSKLRAILKRDKPDLLILIDFAEFNMLLAKTAKNAGVPVLYYIAPQVWAWRRGRIRKLIQRADRIAVVLPFEAELYKEAGPRVAFVGHPLLDLIAPSRTRRDLGPPRLRSRRPVAGDFARQPAQGDSLPARADGSRRPRPGPRSRPHSLPCAGANSDRGRPSARGPRQRSTASVLSRAILIVS